MEMRDSLPGGNSVHSRPYFTPPLPLPMKLLTSLSLTAHDPQFLLRSDAGFSPANSLWIRNFSLPDF